jgi:hypothetical protein
MIKSRKNSELTLNAIRLRVAFFNNGAAIIDVANKPEPFVPFPFRVD